MIRKLLCLIGIHKWFHHEDDHFLVTRCICGVKRIYHGPLYGHERVLVEGKKPK